MFEPDDGEFIQNSMPLPSLTQFGKPTSTLPPMRSISRFSILPPRQPVSPCLPNPFIATLRTVQFLRPLMPLP